MNTFIKIPIQIQYLFRLCLMLCIFFGGSVAAWSQANTPFQCGDNTLYLSQQSPTILQRIDRSTANFTYPTIVAASGTIRYNAIGFNPADGFIYGIINDPTTNPQFKNPHLIKIGSDGVTDMGLVSGLPDFSNYLAGDWMTSSTGNPRLAVMDGNSDKLYLINIATGNVASTITLSEVVRTQDIAYSKPDDRLYFISNDTGKLGKINPNNGNVTYIGSTNTQINFGAMFALSNGKVFGNQNDGDGFYKFNTTTGKRFFIADSPNSVTNDGAVCSDANIIFDADLSVTKTDGVGTYTAGTTTTYTIVVKNNGIFGAGEVGVSDPLPLGISAAQMSYTATTAGGATTGVSGTQTGAINDVVDLPAGATVTYTVTVTIPSGFTGNLVNTVSITPPDDINDTNPNNNTATDTDTPPPPPCPTNITVSVSPSSTICKDDVVTITANGGFSNSSYSWNVGTTANVSSFTIPLASSTFFNVRVTTPGCPDALGGVTVTVNPLPTASISASASAICGGQSTTLTASGAGAGGTYLWSTGETTQAITVSPGATTNYTVTATTAAGCKGTANTTITVNSASASISASASTICAGQSTTLTANGGGTYLWSTGATTQSITVSPGSTTNYTVTVTTSGCSATASTTVNVNPTPPITISASANPICAGQTVTLTANGAIAGSTYAWNIGGVTSQSITSTLGFTTFFSVIVTSPSGCQSSANMSITVNPNPTATKPSDQSVCSEKAMTAVTLSADVAGTTFAWSRDKTGEISGLAAGGSGNIPGATLTNTTTVPQVITFTVTPTSPQGCVGAPVTFTVTVNPKPNITASLPNQNICSGASTSPLNFTADVAGTTYTWTRDKTAEVVGLAASGSGNIPSTVLTNTTGTTQQVTITITPTSPQGCVGPSVQTTIAVRPAPIAVANPTATSICSRGTFSVSLATQPVITENATTYNWTRDHTADVTGMPASGTLTGSPAATLTGALTIVDPQVSAPVTVTYTITPTTNTCAGAPITVQVTVKPLPLGVTTPVNQEICSKGTLNIGLSINPVIAGAVTYSWSRDKTNSAAFDYVIGAASGSSNPVNETLEIANKQLIQDVTVTYTIIPTANGCAGDPVTATVVVHPLPIGKGTPVTQTICSRQRASIDVTTEPVYAGTTFEWTRNNVNGATAVDGLPASGIITANAATNVGNLSGNLTIRDTDIITPVTVTFTFTPVSKFGCKGDPFTVAVVVNPLPKAIGTPMNQEICSGSAFQSLVVQTQPNFPGTTFRWVRDKGDQFSGAVSGLKASDAGPLAQILTITGVPLFNNTGVPQTVTFSFIPTSPDGCDGDTLKMTIKVKPTPLVSVSLETWEVCTGNVAIKVISTDLPTQIVNWSITYPTGTTGTIAQSGTATVTDTNPLILTGVLTNSTTTTKKVLFRFTPFADGCPGIPVLHEINVDPVSTVSKPVIAHAPVNACVNTLDSLVATCATGNPIWKDDAGVAYSNPYKFIVVTEKTYYVSCGTGCNAPVESVTVKPIAAPTEPVAPKPAQVCSGKTATLTATCATGTVTWYQTETATTALGTGNTFTTPVLNNVETFYVSCNDAVCKSKRVSVVVPVVITPTINLPTIAPICAGSTATFDATCVGIIKWYDAPTGGAVHANPYVVPNLAQSLTVYATCTDVVNNCEGERIAVTQQVSPIPAPPIVADVTVCNNQTATLTANCPLTAQAVWFNANMEQLFIGASFVTSALTQSVTYNVTCRTRSSQGTSSPICESTSKQVTVTVRDAVAPPSININGISYAGNQGTICSGTAATLTATCTVGTPQWYSTAGGNTPIAIGPTYTSPVLTSAATFYVTCAANACESPRASVSILTATAPDVVLPQFAAICSGNTATFDASCVGIIKWYDAPTGGIAHANPYVVPNLTQSLTVYATCTDLVTNCESARIPVTQQVSPVPTAPIVTDVTICSNQTATLTANCPSTAQAVWFNATMGQLFVGSPFVTPVLSQSVTYNVTCRTRSSQGTSSPICESTSKQVVVTVNPQPIVQITSTKCSQNGLTYNVTFSVTPSSAIITTTKGTIVGNEVQNVPTGETVKITAALNGCVDSTKTVQYCTVPPTNPPVVIIPPIVTTPVTPVTVCGNIFDIDLGDTHTVTICGGPSKGTIGNLTVNNVTHTLCLTFTPTAGQTGTDQVCLTVCDQTGKCNTVIVPILITPIVPPVVIPPVPPVVVVVPIITPQDSTVTTCMPILDANGPGTNTFTICGAPKHGVANPVTTAGGLLCITYKPTAGFSGRDSMCVIVCDATNLCDTITVPITVIPQILPPNILQPPVVVLPPIVTTPLVPVTVCGFVNDPNVGDTHIVTLCNTPAKGTISGLSVDNTTHLLCMTYTPKPGQTGNDVVCVTVCDQTGLCTTVTVPVTIVSNPTNPPVAIIPPIVTTPSTPVTVCGDIIDPDLGDTHTVTICGAPAKGTISGLIVKNATHEVCLTFNPTAGQTGIDQVCLTVCDQTGKCNTVIVPILITPIVPPVVVPPVPPVVVVVPIITPQDSTVTICMPILDANGPGTNTFTICGAPKHGVANPVTTAGGLLCITYKPTAGFSGRDSMCVIVCDATNLCDTITVPITVIPQILPPTNPQPPVVVLPPIVTTPLVPVTVCGFVNDPNVGDTHTVVLCNTPTKGTISGLSVNNSTHLLCMTYTPKPGQTGNDVVCVTVCDQTGLCTTVTVPVTIIPVINNKVCLQAKVYLQGALFGVALPDMLMRDDLRVKGYLPTTSPYPAMGMAGLTAANTSTLAVVGANSPSGQDAIVDWVFVELRSKISSTTVVDSRSALLQRDGDIVDVDGVSSVTFNVASLDSYYVVVKHRNHLGVMSKAPVDMTSTCGMIDFRKTTTLTYNLDESNLVNKAQVDVVQGVAMWAGNSLYDKQVIYQGTENDANVIYQQVINYVGNVFVSKFYTLKGYYTGDINLNGDTIFQGTGNDVEYIYQNVIKNHPGNTLGQKFFIIKEQIP